MGGSIFPKKCKNSLARFQRGRRSGDLIEATLLFLRIYHRRRRGTRGMNKERGGGTGPRTGEKSLSTTGKRRGGGPKNPEESGSWPKEERERERWA